MAKTIRRKPATKQKSKKIGCTRDDVLRGAVKRKAR